MLLADDQAARWAAHFILSGQDTAFGGRRGTVNRVSPETLGRLASALPLSNFLTDLTGASLTVSPAENNGRWAFGRHQKEQKQERDAGLAARQEPLGNRRSMGSATQARRGSRGIHLAGAPRNADSRPRSCRHHEHRTRAGPDPKHQLA